MPKELTIKQNNLPANIQDLTKFILIGTEKLKSVQAEIRAIDKLDLANEVKEQKQEEAIWLAGALLDAQSKVGEMISRMPPQAHGDKGTFENKLPTKISRKQSHQYQVLAKNLDIVEKVKAEAKANDDLPTRTEVLRQVAQKKNKEVIAQINKQSITEFTGNYDVIVIDPAWPIEKIKRDVAPAQVGLDYPTMSLEQISDFQLPSKDDCHLFLWTTQKFLPEAFKILAGWGFNYVCTFVWHKNGGFQPFKLPQFNCEFILYAKRGNPKFTTTKDFLTCFSADRTGHSEKPDAFYDMVRRVTPGRRIDIFNRRKIEGFDRYGNEAGN